MAEEGGAKSKVAEALGKMGLTYQYHVCAEEIGEGLTILDSNWKEPMSGAQAPVEAGTRRFLVRLRCVPFQAKRPACTCSLCVSRLFRRACSEVADTGPHLACRHVATASRRKRNQFRSRPSISTSLCLVTSDRRVI